jgi:hypothetical protein
MFRRRLAKIMKTLIVKSLEAESLDVSGLSIKSQTPQVLTGAGAVDITSEITHLVTAGVGDALTLADGAEGQEKIVVTKTETSGGDTSVLTPTNFANGTDLTFDAVGDSVQLVFTNGAWHWIGGQAVIA